MEEILEKEFVRTRTGNASALAIFSEGEMGIITPSHLPLIPPMRCYVLTVALVMLLESNWHLLLRVNSRICVHAFLIENTLLSFPSQIFPVRISRKRSHFVSDHDHLLDDYLLRDLNN